MKRAFTLVEIMVAVAILAGALLVLVQSQASAVLMTTETEKLLAATMLAREKMAEVQLMVESEGFGEQDIEEDGDFEEFGDAEGLDLGLDLDETYEDFHWAYTVRKIELELPGDLTGAAEGLAGQGYWGDQDPDQQGRGDQEEAQQTPGLDDMGVSSDMITEMLGGYIREVRVLVWWGENEDEEDQVEIVSHVVNANALSALAGAFGSSGGGGGRSGRSGRSGQSGSGGAPPSGAAPPSIPGGPQGQVGGKGNK